MKDDDKRPSWLPRRVKPRGLRSDIARRAVVQKSRRGPCMTVVAPNPTKTAPVTGFLLLPAGLRNFVRSRETGLVLVSIVIGLLTGLLVTVISRISRITHSLLFDIPFNSHPTP